MSTLADLFDVLHQVIADTWPGRTARRLIVELVEGDRIELPVPPPRPTGAARAAALPEEAFVPTPFQLAILAALDGKALRTDALGAAAGDRGRLFRHPGGLKELQAHGLVSHHPRLGYFRPDALPPQLAAGGTSQAPPGG